MLKQANHRPKIAWQREAKMNDQENRATRCSPCKKQASTSSASSLSISEVGKSYMYSDTFKHSSTTSAQINNNNSPTANSIPNTNPYQRQPNPQHGGPNPLTDTFIDSNIANLLQRDEHLTSSSKSSTSILATSLSITSNIRSQYEPSITDQDPMPSTRPLRTRSRTFLYPHSYDSNLVHHSKQSTESQSSADSFQTPTFYMSTMSSSSPSSQSIPPLNIKQKQPKTVSPLSYPELHPLQLYAHEQEQSTTTSVSDDSISTKTPHSITSISREIISNLSTTLQSPQCQTLIEEILQDCRTFDSLRTQVE